MSDIVNKNENLELELDDNTILSNLFGVNDRNLSLIEKINQVKIQYRGNKIKISGNKKSIFETRKTILYLFKEILGFRNFVYTLSKFIIKSIL